MERLQEALSRARDRRKESGESGGDAGQARGPIMPRAPQQSTQDGDPVSATWRALPQYMPDEALLKSHRIVSFFGGRPASPFDMMRTKIVQQAKTNGWRRIVITSPTPRCGKSTITTNLAFALAKQADLRTLVVEADMRRPELARLLGIREPHAFAQVLAGKAAPEDNMIAYGTNLAFATNQQPTANPAELLQSVKAQEVVASLEAKFAPDIILFDAAPMLASDDTTGLLQYMDAALIVAAAELSTIEEVDQIETEIAAITNVMGVVLNKTRYAPTVYGYDEHYY
ncbi:MAG: CpsD/CapB family tyrosine-protein kinase [Rhodobacteraceae bacterium]|nr:CpsD/CapB family tyrosine-protein kinase [Paracoccaceae bacterium]